MNPDLLTVHAIPDGDTVRCGRTVDATSAEVRVRLAYIDAPELSQAPYGLAARAYLRGLLFLGERIEARILGQDVYGRLIAEMIRARDGGNCGLRLVYGGYAALWRCPRSRGEYYAAQDLAQRRRLGIWRVAGPWQTPWLHRGPQQ